MGKLSTMLLTLQCVLSHASYELLSGLKEEVNKGRGTSSRYPHVAALYQCLSQ